MRGEGRLAQPGDAPGGLRVIVTRRGRVFACLAGVITLIGPITDASWAAPASAIPSVTISVNVVGKPPPAAPGLSSYPVSVTCRSASGASPKELALALTPGQVRVITVADLPGLSVTDRCTVSSRVDGAQTEFLTTQPDRTDGSTPDPVGGLIDADGFHSAPALANGQTIAVTYRYTGDLLISKTVTGAPEFSIGTYQLQVSCSDNGFLQTLSLANSQTRLITGIPVGSTCQITEPSTPGARFEDNSGDPFDATVVIAATSAACWDLRNTAPSCRVTVTSTHSYGAADQQIDSTVNTVPNSTTTTVVEDTNPAANQAATTAAPAAPAPVEEPELLDESEETVG